MVFLKEFFEKNDFEENRNLLDLSIYSSSSQNKNTYEPRHEISNNVICATSKGSDQPAHMRSLIRAFASRLIILWILS